MGLDMYAHAVKGSAVVGAITKDLRQEDVLNDDLHYWRKHPNLHGWMQRLYVEKGGDADPRRFNCVNVELTGEDLDRLQADIDSGALPGTSGFFFGQSDGSERADDLEFIQKARAVIDAGNRVFYSSWW